MAEHEFPISGYTPAILERGVGIAGCHVGDGVGDDKYRVAIPPGICVYQIDARQPIGSLEARRGGDGACCCPTVVQM